MAGGAQLHSRENLLAIGGAIDTSTLAEDTYTTIKTQLAGRRALFDGNAVVWAEEPDSVAALWKQRVRWGRGNLQITLAFRDLWFRPDRNRLFGNIAFGFLWFSVALMPLFMIVGSVGADRSLLPRGRPGRRQPSRRCGASPSSAISSRRCSPSPSIRATARRCWFEGIAFPGLLSLGVMLMAVLGLKPFAGSGGLAAARRAGHGATSPSRSSSAGRPSPPFLAWVVYRIDKAGAPKWLRNVLLVLVGYGPLLCAICLAAIVARSSGTPI